MLNYSLLYYVSAPLALPLLEVGFLASSNSAPDNTNLFIISSEQALDMFGLTASPSFIM